MWCLDYCVFRRFLERTIKLSAISFWGREFPGTGKSDKWREWAVVCIDSTLLQFLKRNLFQLFLTQYFPHLFWPWHSYFLIKCVRNFKEEIRVNTRPGNNLDESIMSRWFSKGGPQTKQRQHHLETCEMGPHLVNQKPRGWGQQPMFLTSLCLSPSCDSDVATLKTDAISLLTPNFPLQVSFFFAQCRCEAWRCLSRLMPGILSQKPLNNCLHELSGNEGKPKFVRSAFPFLRDSYSDVLSWSLSSTKTSTLPGRGLVHWWGI